MEGFGNNLRALRNQKGMTQQELSDSMGISKSALNMYERGARQPNFETLELIADYFNVSTDFLLGKEDVMHCPICFVSYNPLDDSDSKNHEIIHKRFLDVTSKLGFFYSPSKANTTRVVCESFLNGKNLPADGQASHVENLLKADYSDYLRSCNYNTCVTFRSFCCDALRNGKYLDMISVEAKNILFSTYGINDKSALNARDNRDIKKDIDSIMEKLSNKEYGPAAYDGQDLSDESLELFRDELEIALKRLKLINKEKYNPNKNKK